MNIRLAFQEINKNENNKKVYIVLYINILDMLVTQEFDHVKTLSKIKL